MNTMSVYLGIALLTVVISMLGFAETVLIEMGVSRLSKLLAGEQGHEEFTPDEQVTWLTSILILRLFAILALGGLAVLGISFFELGQGAAAFAVLALGLVLVLSDTLARRHARSGAQRAASQTLSIVRTLSRLLSPLLSFVFAITSPFSPSKMDPIASLEDLQDQIVDLRSRGVLKQTQSEIFQSVLDFGETIAREVMVPRVDMICTKLGTRVDEVLSLMHEHGFSRVPVYKESIDEILGFVYVKDLIADFDALERPLTEPDLREVVVVPGTRKVGEILRDLQAQSRALAVVLDEYGGTDGLLTVEDILEELVGEINDEYDTEIAEVEHLDDGTVLVDAKMIVEDVNSTLDIEIPTDGPETLGGYLYHKFGHAPQVGESVSMDDVVFAVEGVQRNRITWVRVQRLNDESEADSKDREQVA